MILRAGAQAAVAGRARFYDNRISPDHKKRNHIRQLEALGYKVTLEPAA